VPNGYQNGPRANIGSNRVRPPAASVPFGTVWHNGTDAYVAQGDHWRTVDITSMTAAETPAIPIPAPREIKSDAKPGIVINNSVNEEVVLSIRLGKPIAEQFTVKPVVVDLSDTDDDAGTEIKDTEDAWY